MKRAVAARDLGCRSILTMAALSKSKDMLRDALAVLEEHLTIDEVIGSGILDSAGQREIAKGEYLNVDCAYFACTPGIIFT